MLLLAEIRLKARLNGITTFNLKLNTFDDDKRKGAVALLLLMKAWRTQMLLLELLKLGSGWLKY